MNTTTLNQIEASELQIKKILSDDYCFAIPPYQRPYAWEISQAGELLTDLYDAMNGQEGPRSVYFLGSIVLVKEPGKPEARIVDGQQRLTTLTILLSVIRDLTSDSDQKNLIGTYIKQKANPLEELPERLRLQLRHADQFSFARWIQTEGATLELPLSEGLEGSKARIVENAKHFHAELSKLKPSDRDSLIKYILNNCYLVVVRVPSDSAARRIFTVLNARGLDLIATDILKANLLDRARQQAQHLETELSNRWEEIETDLGRERFIDLFTHIRMVYQREKPRSALEDGFAEFVPPFKGNPTIFVQNTLEPYSNSLSILHDNNDIVRQFGPRTAALVRSLSRLDNKDWEPPILLFIKQYLDGKQIDIESFVANLETLAYYLFVTRSDVNARMLRYGSVMDEIDPREGKIVRNTGLELSKDEKFSFFDALNEPIYLKTRVVKPLLLRLDLALSDGSALYNYPTISVEHVMPRTIVEGTEWYSTFLEEDHSYWLHRLANLVLLSHRKNVKASNLDFERKKSEYFLKNDACPFLLTQQISEVGNWNQGLLKARQVDLIRSLARDWSISSEFEEWRTAQAQSQTPC